MKYLSATASNAVRVWNIYHQKIQILWNTCQQVANASFTTTDRQCYLWLPTLVSTSGRFGTIYISHFSHDFILLTKQTLRCLHTSCKRSLTQGRQTQYKLQSTTTAFCAFIPGIFSRSPKTWCYINTGAGIYTGHWDYLGFQRNLIRASPRRTAIVFLFFILIQSTILDIYIFL